MPEAKITLTLKDMPEDIKDFILVQQLELRRSPSGKTKQISQETTIYKLLYSHPKFKKA